jgi:titin
LTNGTGYTFQVAAVNDAKTGGYSARSSEVTPRTVPGVPTSAGAVANKSGGVDVKWEAPTSNGGAAISDYLITICGGTNCKDYGVDIKTNNQLTFTVPETSSRTMVGFKWSFLVRAVNEAGPGAQTSLIGPVDPYRAPNAPFPVPVASIDDKGGVSVRWVAPNANGATISGYIVKSCTSGVCTPYNVEFTTSPASITGLGKGTPYTFTVTAKNIAGIGAESGASNVVTPRSAPEPPTNATAVANDIGGVVVEWKAPGDNGGNTITDYTVQSCAGGVCTSFAHIPVSNALSQTVIGLDKGKIYTFKVAAVNTAGISLFADAASSATPRAKSAMTTGSCAPRISKSTKRAKSAPRATPASNFSPYPSCIRRT